MVVLMLYSFMETQYFCVFIVKVKKQCSSSLNKFTLIQFKSNLLNKKCPLQLLQRLYEYAFFN